MAIYTYLVATNEQNSFGITQGRWFDGKMEMFTIERNAAWLKQFELKVTKIEEIFNLESICSHDSYYRCLAKRFRTFNFDTAAPFFVNGSKCYFGQLCTPFSLPSDGEDTIPICTNTIDQACYGNILLQLGSQQKEKCKRACHVKEFSFKECERETQNVADPGSCYKNGDTKMTFLQVTQVRFLII